jgi:nucleotide-binding universal stress UspA family protein
MSIKLKKIRRRLKDQSGQVAIIVGVMLAALVGMLAYVVDTGNVYESRRSFQTVADAAALAGAQELPDANAAEQAAVEYAQLHDIPPEGVIVSVESTFVANDTIKVTAQDLEKELFFGGIFGNNSTEVGADASAIIGSPSMVNNIVPFGVLEEDWVPGDEYTLKWGPQEDGHNHGNFGALALGGTGGNNYRDNIREGYSGELNVGDVVDTEPGNMMGPTVQGTNDRINDYHDYTFNSFDELTDEVDGKYVLRDSSDSQFVVCPLIDWVPFGRKEVTIMGFVPFIITGTSGSEVYGTFIDRALIVTSGSIAPLDEHGLVIIRLQD